MATYRAGGGRPVTTPAGAARASHKNLPLRRRGDGHACTTEPEGGAVGDAA